MLWLALLVIAAFLLYAMPEERARAFAFGRFQPHAHQSGEDALGEGLAQAFQRPGRQLLGEELHDKRCRAHAAAVRASIGKPRRSRDS